MKRIIFYFVAVALITSCGKSGNLLQGEFKNGAGSLVYLERFEKNLPIVVDSAEISEDGTFTLSFPNKVDIYRLRINPQDYAILVLDSTHKPVVKADAKQILATYTITGSPDSEWAHEFFKETNNYLVARDKYKLQLEVLPLADSVKRMSILAEVEKVKNDWVTYRHKFVDEHPNSAALITIMNQFDPITELEYFKKVESAMALTMPGSDYHMMASSMVSQAETQIQFMEMQKAQEAVTAGILSPGTAAPEIQLPNPDGKVIKLSSLKGKYVLLDFWASWCVPCRKENPNVVALYNKYNKKGFEVYSVSLDDKKEKWVKAISDDGLIWPAHVSELLMWNSSVVPQYGIQSIPFTVLLDKQGKVIATNLRGAELELKLQELLGA